MYISIYTITSNKKLVTSFSYFRENVLVSQNVINCTLAKYNLKDTINTDWVRSFCCKIEKYQEAYGTTLPRMRGQRDNQLKRKQTSPLRRRGPRENQLTQKQNSPLRMRGPWDNQLLRRQWSPLRKSGPWDNQLFVPHSWSHVVSPAILFQLRILNS